MCVFTNQMNFFTSEITHCPGNTSHIKCNGTKQQANVHKCKKKKLLHDTTRRFGLEEKEEALVLRHNNRNVDYLDIFSLDSQISPSSPTKTPCFVYFQSLLILLASGLGYYLTGCMPHRKHPVQDEL